MLIQFGGCQRSLAGFSLSDFAFCSSSVLVVLQPATREASRRIRRPRSTEKLVIDGVKTGVLETHRTPGRNLRVGRIVEFRHTVSTAQGPGSGKNFEPLKNSLDRKNRA
jgi:hypothetical protein